MMILSELANNMTELNIGGIVAAIAIVPILIIALVIVVYILIIRAICKYMAKQNAKQFKYDYLAERIAEELYKKQNTTQREDTTQPEEPEALPG